MIKKLSMLFISLVFLTPFVSFISLEAKEPVQVEPYSIEEARQDALDMGVEEEYINSTLNLYRTKKPLDSMSSDTTPIETVYTEDTTIEYFADGSFRGNSISGGTCSGDLNYYTCDNRIVKYTSGVVTMKFFADYTTLNGAYDRIDNSWGPSVRVVGGTGEYVYFNGGYSKESIKGPATATFSANIKQNWWLSNQYTLQLQVGFNSTKVVKW